MISSCVLQTTAPMQQTVYKTLNLLNVQKQQELISAIVIKHLPNIKLIHNFYRRRECLNDPFLIANKLMNQYQQQTISTYPILFYQDLTCLININQIQTIITYYSKSLIKLILYHCIIIFVQSTYFDKRQTKMSISSLNKQNSRTKQNKVHIYLRNYEKIAIMVSVFTPILNNHLKFLISNKYQTPSQQLALFFNGVRIDAFPDQNTNLKEKSIIHVVHLSRTNTEQLNVFFKFTNGTKDKLKVKTFSKKVIKQIFYNEVLPYFGKNEKQIFLAYLGKPINIFKTFKDQYVENECQILILQFRLQMKQVQLIDESKNYRSNASTQMVAHPVVTARDKKSIMAHKQKIKQNNQKKPFYQHEPQKQQEYTAPLQNKQQGSVYSNNYSQSKVEMVAPSQEKSQSVAPFDISLDFVPNNSYAQYLQQKPNSNFSNQYPHFKKKPTNFFPQKPE